MSKGSPAICRDVEESDSDSDTDFPHDWRRMSTPEFRQSQERAAQNAEAKSLSRSATTELKAAMAQTSPQRAAKAKAKEISNFAKAQDIIDDFLSPLSPRIQEVAVQVKTTTASIYSSAEEFLSPLSPKFQEVAVHVKTTTASIYISATSTRLGMTLSCAVFGAVMAGMLFAFLGLLCGLTIGVLLALFTFGISLPVGGFLGTTIGGSMGIITGGLSGAALGYGGFTYRKEVHQLVLDVRSRFLSSSKSISGKVKDSASHVSASIKKTMIESGYCQACTGGSDSKQHAE